MSQVTTTGLATLQFRPIFTSAIRHSRRSSSDFPITLHISLPQYDYPTLHRFTSHDNIANILAPRNFFVDPSSGTSIHIDQVKDIDPSVVYDLVGPDWTHRQKGTKSSIRRLKTRRSWL